jgi:hypothetical protein
MTEYENILNLIQSLTTRVDNLEKENRELKDLSRNTAIKKIINLVESLPIPPINFDKWADQTLLLVEKNLEVVFQKDLLTGINSVINDSINESGELPIAVFNRRPNNYYYYQDDSWKPLEMSVIDHFIGRIAYRFLVEFKRCWYVPNLDNINKREDYKIMYNSYYMNILGGKMTDESRNRRVKNALYMLIKQ